MSKNHDKNRGFAAMDPERQREISSEGGRAAHAGGNAHEWDSEEARAAGRLGGAAAHHHRAAAFHSATAAHHHGEAARHHAGGRHHEATMHAAAAHEHGQSAAHHAGQARDEAHTRGWNAQDEPRDDRGRFTTEGNDARGGSLSRDWDPNRGPAHDPRSTS